MKLWLDDVRPAPKGWAHAENYDEAVNVLQAHLRGDCVVEVASLDHDLGMVSCKQCRMEQPTNEGASIVAALGCKHGEKTGYHVVCWMEENNVWPGRVIIHSANPVGAQRMYNVAKRHTDARMVPYRGQEI